MHSKRTEKLVKYLYEQKLTDTQINSVLSILFEPHQNNTEFGAVRRIEKESIQKLAEHLCTFKTDIGTAKRIDATATTIWVWLRLQGDASPRDLDISSSL